MVKSAQIEIPLSKGKTILMLAGATAFVLIGIWFLVKPPEIENAVFGQPIFLRCTGAIAFLFFGWIALVLVKKISGSPIGLIINDEGILDNSGGVPAGQIPWKDIREITLLKVANQRFIMIVVNNPEDYIKLQNNFIRRKTMEINYKSYGSPISISSNTLKYDLDELFHLLQEKLNEQKVG